ncbi:MULTISPECIES: hypothetical protein [Streptomyces]|uniref:Uncharacterized protein n=1 Tax=Streptomyces bacillaris TaxID=68179 RepID=A0ABW6E073_9ACTN|nr:hypothetical protein [Streptomyces nanshensis]
MRGGDGLFEVEPVELEPTEKKRPQGRPAVDKRFRAFDPSNPPKKK